MKLIDFSSYQKGQIMYGGSERKASILIPNTDGSFSNYMLKFRKKTPFGTRNNHLSEYLGSHILDLLGFKTQKTFLGTYHGEDVVACKNFIAQDEQFVPFNDVGESTLDQDKDTYQYEYADIMQMLHDNSKLTDSACTISLSPLLKSSFTEKRAHTTTLFQVLSFLNATKHSKLLSKELTKIKSINL